MLLSYFFWVYILGWDFLYTMPSRGLLFWCDLLLTLSRRIILPLYLFDASNMPCR